MSTRNIEFTVVNAINDEARVTLAVREERSPMQYKAMAISRAMRTLPDAKPFRVTSINEVGTPVPVPAKITVTSSGYEYDTGIARKEGQCQYGIMVSGDRNSRCQAVIKPGERFIYGESTGEAGGFARNRWCMAHADPKTD